MYTRRDADGLSEMRRAAASEQRLARASQQGDELSFDRLVCSHLRLVFAIAAEYRRFGTPMSDLVSEGLLGLVATRRIVGPPSTRKGRSVMANMVRAKHQLTQSLGATPDRDTLARLESVA